VTDVDTNSGTETEPQSDTLKELEKEALEQASETALAGAAEAEPRTQWQLFRRRFFRHKLAVISLVVIVLLTFACFAAGWIAPYDRNEQNVLLGPTPPSAQHWMGTDQLGRDQLTEILFAGQLSLKIGFAVAIVSTLIGVLLGATAGFFGKWIDNLLMRLTDLFLIVPGLLILALLLSYVRVHKKFLWWDLGDQFLFWKIQIDTPIIVILALVGWTYIARVVRGQVLSLKEKEFVEAARAAGASNTRIIVRHILPNTISTIMVNATLAIAAAIVTESTLSFLGFGVQLPLNSWGRMLYDARGTVGTPKVYLLYFPGLFLLITVLAVNFLGDGLRDAFDPKAKQE
jgi:peptide/nickel transport system permease protein